MIAKRIDHKGQCEHAQTAYARRVCRKAAAAAAQPTNREVTMDLAHAAATVIARARDEYGQGAAPFDYMISVRGIGGPLGELGSQVYVLANEHLPAVVPGDGTLDKREANAARLWQALAAELAAYEARCRNRKYTGWSNASRGPIRYAS